MDIILVTADPSNYLYCTFDYLSLLSRPEDEDIQYILQNIWKLANSYRLANDEKLDETSVWYIMDEFGSAIEHKDAPNTQVHPFLYAPNNKLDAQTISYNVKV